MRPSNPGQSNGEGLRDVISFQGFWAFSAFLNPESGFPGPENELGAGATLREAKGIVGALCKNRTPTDGSFSVLAPRRHVVRCPSAVETFQGGKQPGACARLHPQVICFVLFFPSHACVFVPCDYLSTPLLRVAPFCSTEVTKRHRLEPLPEICFLLPEKCRVCFCLGRTYPEIARFKEPI